MTTVQRDAISLPATGLSIFNTTTNTENYYNGSQWVEGATSFNILGTTNQIIVTPSGSNIVLSTPQNLNITANFQAGTLGVNLASTLAPSAVFEVDSTTQGILIPRGTITQRNAITSPAIGLQFYDTTSATIDYFDGTAWQQGLAIDRVNAGANITLDDSVPGQLTISASGGGTGPTAAYASWVINNNGLTQSIQTSYLPVNSASFSDQNSSDFTNTLVTMPGSLLTSPVSIYNGASTQFFSVVGAASCLINTISSNNYYIAISILKANNVILTSPFVNVINLKNANDYQDIPVSGIVELSTGDGVFYQVKADSPANLSIKYVTSLVTNIPGSIPSTDGLSQGSSNIYLSQNGGSTFEYLSGSAIIGDIPQFSSTGGQLTDSGIPSANLIKTTTSLGGSLSGNLPNPSLSSTGISQIIAITQVSGSTQTMTDSAPINRYILQNSSPCTLTLPASINAGHSFEIIGGRTAGWIIAQNSGQSIALGTNTTTTGIGGSLSSTYSTDSLILSCTTTDTQLTAYGVQGNITYV